jgi:LuxR family maltose regulon positive regulatory protein
VSADDQGGDALDDHRRLYRYHRLFADVLQAHLLDEQPDKVPELHRQVSTWYEQNGEPSEAIRHALAAEDFERAAGLVELAIPAVRRDRQDATLRRWLEALPEEVIQVRPVLSIGFAGALMAAGEVAGVEVRLRDAERWLNTMAAGSKGSDAPPGEMIVVDTEELPRLPGTIEMYRAALALARGDAPGTVRHAEQAIALAPEEDHLSRAGAAGLMGLAFWGSGDLEAGHRAYAECMAGLWRAGHIADTFGCAIALADIRIAQGRLGDAMRTYEHALELSVEQQAPEQGGPVLRGTADMYVGMSEIHRERDDLPAATRCLLRSQDLGEHTGLPQNPYRWRVAMARIREAEGDLDGALDLLNEAERLYVSDFFPDVRPIPAMKARLWVALGRLGEALGWAREKGLSIEDDLSYLREFEHITLARLLLGQYAAERGAGFLEEATELLERLLRAAEAGARTGTVIEILVLQALAIQAQGNIPAALASLERVLTLSEPEGYVRIFVNEGTPMASLLRAAAKRKIAPSYVRRLLTALSKTEETTPVKQSRIEPLSERELEVIRLLGTDLDGPDIARQLVVSLNTVRTHQEHLRQARREQSSSSGTPSRRTRSVVPKHATATPHPNTSSFATPTVPRPMTRGGRGACRGWRPPHRVPDWRPLGRAVATAPDRTDRRYWSAWFLPTPLRSDK